MHRPSECSPDFVILEALQQVRQVQLPDFGRDEEVLFPQHLGSLQTLIGLPQRKRLIVKPDRASNPRGRVTAAAEASRTASDLKPQSQAAPGSPVHAASRVETCSMASQDASGALSMAASSF